MRLPRKPSALFLLPVAVALAIRFLYPAPQPALAPQAFVTELARVADSRDVQVINNVRRLPYGVRMALRERHYKYRFPGAGLNVSLFHRYIDLDCANPGQRWNDSCLHSRYRPNAQMQIAGVLGDRCFVAFDRGGIGHSRYIAVFQLRGWGQANLLGISDLNANTIPKIRRLLHDPKRIAQMERYMEPTDSWQDLLPGPSHPTI